MFFKQAVALYGLTRNLKIRRKQIHMCQHTRFWYLTYQRTMNAQTSLHIRADSSTLLLLAYTKYGSRWSLRQKNSDLQPSRIRQKGSLTYLSRMELSNLINWTSPFPLLGGIYNIFFSNFNTTYCKKKVETLIRRRILRRLISVFTVCICPTKKTLGLYGLKEAFVHT